MTDLLHPASLFRGSTSRCSRPSSSGARSHPCNRQSYNDLKVRFSATVGEEPEFEVALPSSYALLCPAHGAACTVHSANFACSSFSEPLITPARFQVGERRP